MSWLGAAVWWVFSADPLLVSLIVLAWLCGAVAVLLVDPRWSVPSLRLRGAQRAPRPLPPVSVEEPMAEVVRLEKRRPAA